MEKVFKKKMAQPEEIDSDVEVVEVIDDADQDNADEIVEEIVEEPTTEEVTVEEKVIDNNNLERLQRLMAEFDNYRKRTEKEKTMVYDMAISSIVTDLLSTIDNFERALKVECSDKPFYEGVVMIYKQLLGAIEKIGVLPIETVDKEFDPAFHNAIFHIEDENVGKNIIVEEMQKGYIYKDKVLRHSLVKVAN